MERVVCGATSIYSRNERYLMSGNETCLLGTYVEHVALCPLEASSRPSTYPIVSREMVEMRQVEQTIPCRALGLERAFPNTFVTGLS